jgi:RNA polymerase sigma-70 factor (ECF subfamily)
LIARSSVAEELIQEAAVRALTHLESIPETPNEFRAWLFRVATNLAHDHRRKPETVRETVMVELRQVAQTSPSFAVATKPLVGSPESQTIAREHLAACLACTLGRFPTPQAAALLLVEMVGFTVAETAGILEARPAQVKGWLTATRNATDEQYGRTCALIAKQGMCHQCVELDRFYAANRGDPLANTDRTFDDRLAILKSQPPARWTAVLGDLFGELF